MKRSTRRLPAIGPALAALFAAFALALPVPVRGQDSGIQVGTKAPAVTVQTLDGKTVNLGEFIGKSPVLIEFWATWCPVCKELDPAMKAAHAKWGSRVKFIGVSVNVNQTIPRVKAFVAKYAIPGDQYWDGKGDATDKYEVPATSYVVIIDKNGKVVYTGVGAKQDLDAAIKKAL
jgi:thiol-disulfide isomerase/thioredoxin